MSHLKDVGFMNKCMSDHHNLLRKVFLTQVRFEISRSCLFFMNLQHTILRKLCFTNVTFILPYWEN